MKRLLVVTMVAGLMSFGAIAGQHAKPAGKTGAAPAAAAATTADSTTPAPPLENAKTLKKHKSAKKHKETMETPAKPKN